MNRRPASNPAVATPRKGAVQAVVALLLITLCLNAQATTYLQRAPQQLALDADLIFVGTVSEESVEVDAGRPWTVVTFEVEELLLDRDLDSSPREEGEEPKRPTQVTLRFLGGGATGQRLTVSGLPSYRRGERYLIFAYQRAGVASPLVGVRQGSWSVAVDGLRDADGAYLTVFDQGGLQRADSTAESSDLDTVLAAIRAVLDSGVTAEAPLPESDGGAERPAPNAPESESAEAAADQADGGDSVDSDGEPEEANARGGPDEAEARDEPADTEAQSEPADASDEPADAVGQPEPAEAEPAAPIRVTYRVDSADGPLTLSSAASAAAAAWQAATADAVAFDPGGAETSGDVTLTDNLIRYGSPTLLGPDALSLTLAHDGAASTEVLVSPDVGTSLQAVLLHELGILAGLPEGGDGVMAFAIDPALDEPTAADVAALLERRDYPQQDLNRDGIVDFYDLALFGRAYGESGLNLAADFNGDGVVDDADLAILEAAYQFTPPSEQAPASVE